MTPTEMALTEAAARTFEDMAFLAFIPEAESDLPNTEFCIDIEVAYVGPFTGRLVLTGSEDLLAAVAENMLGEDDGPSREQQIDALGEVGNVICGNVLPAVFDRANIFDLARPAPTNATARDARSGEVLVARVPMAFDTGRAEISLFRAD